MLSIESKMLNHFKAQRENLVAKDSIKYNSLHLVETNNGDVYKFCKHAIQDDKVGMCDVCYTKLTYQRAKKGIPLHTFGHYDFDKVPNDFPN